MKTGRQDNDVKEVRRLINSAREGKTGDEREKRKTEVSDKAAKHREKQEG